MSVIGLWDLQVETPMGEQASRLLLRDDGSGEVASQLGSSQFRDAQIVGDSVMFTVTINAMGQQVELAATAVAEGDSVCGRYESHMGIAEFTGSRVPS